MPAAYVTLLASAATFVGLSALFALELHRGKRFLAPARLFLDRGVLRIDAALSAVLRFVQRDVLRQTFHYILHQFLRLGLAITRFVEGRLSWLLRRNRAVALRVSKGGSAARTKLTEIAAHKRSAALSDDEKLEHKERSIGTKL